jgi:hypothetical protein
MPHKELLTGGGFTAVVRSPDGVRFVATASDTAGRAASLVEYIRQRCDYTLWPDDALRVRAMIDDQNAEGAIATYFASVGQRWDEERLELREPDGATPRRRATVAAASS